MLRLYVHLTLCLLFILRADALADAMFLDCLSSAQEKRRAASFMTMHGIAGSRSLVLKPIETEAQEVFRARLLTNFHNLTRAPVTDSTEHTYCTGVKCWRQFVTLTAIPDVFCSIVPPWYVPGPWSFAATMIGAFLAYLVTENGVGYPAASGYVSGVRHFFRTNTQSLAPFNCISLQDARKSLDMRHKAKESNADARRLPFTHPMFTALRFYVGSVSNQKHFAIVLAAQLAVTLILRCSEYLYSIEEHFIRGQDVVFRIRDNASGSVRLVTSSDVWAYDDHTLLMAYVYLRSAKNDQSGDGNGYGFAPAPVSETNAFDIASDLYKHARTCRPLRKCPFFSSSNGVIFVLRYKEYKEALKSAAFHVTGSSARIGTHSCRILGASQQHAAQVSDLDIMFYMRSKSLSFLRYIRLSTSRTEGYRSAAANPALYTDDDLLVLHLSSLHESLPAALQVS